MKTYRNEKGQALVLIVFAVIGMLGLAALAVDGGMMYAERRRAQNAADSAALAAALAGVQGRNVQTAASNALIANGFTLDNVVVTVHNPPISGPYATVADSGDYYQVIIKMDIKPVFSQFVFTSGLEFTTETVARGNNPNGTPSPFGPVALYLTNNMGGGAFQMSGTPDLIVTGTIYSNDDFGVNGGPTVQASSIVVKNLPAASIHVNGVTPDPVKGTIAIPVLPAPACPPASDHSYDRTASGNTLYPGNYKNGITKGDYTFTPGIYCITGGVTWNGNVEMTAEGVTIVMLNGDVRINGTSTMKFSAPTAAQVANPYNGDPKLAGVEGVWLYMADSNHNQIYWTGDNESYYKGVAYAPNNQCQFGGGSERSAYDGFWVCDNIWMHGSNIFELSYKEYLPQPAFQPSTIEVVQ